jgi:CRISPR/Cas system CSM-associated protein Csm3 (group 7 of RAMP superfamily)
LTQKIKEKMQNNLRYIARVFIETNSGFSINSGDKSLLLDNQIARDANGLPYIPGTSLAGIVQHACLSNGLSQAVGNIFGCTQADAKEKGLPNHKDSENGSRLVFSSAHLVGSDGKTVVAGLTCFDSNKEYFQRMLLLPQRDHVRVTDRGAADVQNHGKFDRELVYKGTRFCFEIKLVGTAADRTDFEKILELLQDETVRIGAGTRKGAGSFKILPNQSHYWVFDLTKQDDLLAFLEKSSSFNEVVKKKKEAFPKVKTLHKGWKSYQLNLSAEDFFLFGTSLPDAEADNTPKEEVVIEWGDNQNLPSFKKMYLLPATSIKGAISHRTAYYHNLQSSNYLGSQETFKPEDFGWDVQTVLDAGLSLPETDNWAHDDQRWEQAIQNLEQESFENFLSNSKDWQQFNDTTNKHGGNENPSPTGENNDAIKVLFGEALDDKARNISERKGQIGRIIIDDIYLDEPDAKSVVKVFNHVKIDRFTGGAYNGALFQEKALNTNQSITINLLVNLNGLDNDSEYITAFESALADLKNGHLALGGATTKGYGVFKNQTT